MHARLHPSPCSPHNTPIIICHVSIHFLFIFYFFLFLFFVCFLFCFCFYNVNKLNCRKMVQSNIHSSIALILGTWLRTGVEIAASRGSQTLSLKKKRKKRKTESVIYLTKNISPINNNVCVELKRRLFLWLQSTGSR